LAVLLLLSIITMALWPTQAEAELSPSSLVRLAAQSDLVFVGRVERVIEMPVKALDDVDLIPLTEASLAEVTVLEWIKGTQQTKTLWLWASATWVCDVTMAIEGEVAVFYLDGQGVADVVTAASVKRVNAATRGAPVHRIAMFGRGRMPIREIAGRAYATVWTSDVRLPADFDTIPGPDLRYTAFKRGVLVEDLRRVIKRGSKGVPEQGQGRVLDLLRIVGGPFGEVRNEALSQIVDRADRSLPILIKILGDAQSPLREAAAEILGCRPEHGEAALAKGLASKEVGARRAAAFAIEWISREAPLRDEDLLDQVSKGLGDPDPEVRWLLLRSLDLDSPDEDKLVTAILAALADGSPAVQRQATWILRAYPAYLLEVRKGAARTEIEARLLALAASSDLRLRRTTWEALSNAAGPAAWKAAQRALADADPVVRVNATSALARMSSEAASQRLIALLGDKDAWVRRAAAHALGMSPAKEGVLALARALGDPDPLVRGLAVWALGEMGTQAATAAPALEILLKREERLLGDEIREALAKIR